MGVLDNMYQLSVCDTPKKRAKRMIWTDEQERSFLRAVAKLGEDAIPSEIHNEMKHPEISRKQVSSHLQTYRKKNAQARSPPIGFVGSLSSNQFYHSQLLSHPSEVCPIYLPLSRPRAPLYY